MSSKWISRCVVAAGLVLACSLPRGEVTAMGYPADVDTVLEFEPLPGDAAAPRAGSGDPATTSARAPATARTSPAGADKRAAVQPLPLDLSPPRDVMRDLKARQPPPPGRAPLLPNLFEPSEAEVVGSNLDEISVKGRLITEETVEGPGTRKSEGNFDGAGISIRVPTK